MMPEKGRYSPFEMSQEVFVTLSPTSDKAEYNQKLDIITGLREVERKYVEEVILAPNVFDISLEKESLGVAGALFEIYRRYPVLFASQQLIRKSSRNSVVRAGMGLISLLLLDALYMTALQLAAGVKMEELEEKWKTQPWYEGTKIATRLPIMGKYLGIIAPLGTLFAKGMTTGRFPSTYDFTRSLSENSGFIPTAALGSAVGSIFQAGKAVFGGDVKDQDILNATRIIPFADSAIRLAIYTLGGDSIERKASRPLGVSGSTNQGRSSGPTAMYHYGMTKEISGTNWEYYTRQMLREVLNGNQAPGMQPHYADVDLRNSFRNIEAARPQQPAPPAPQKPAPPEITTPTSKPEDVVESILDRSPEKAPDSLLD